MFSKKYFIFGIVFGTIALLSFIFYLPDGRLHIVFCSVGQGDAAYIRTPNNQDMLIDGGPDDKVLDCLGRHMPFYDRTIDVVVLTHPQKDHLQGLISIVERYNIKYAVLGVEGNDTAGYKSLVETIKKKNIPVKNLYTGDKFTLGKVEFDVLWPEKKWVAEHTSDLLAGGTSEGLPNEASQGSLNQNTFNTGGLKRSLGHASDRTRKLEIGAVLGLQTDTELNDFSYYLDLKYGSFNALFPGDGDIHMQPELMRLGELPRVTVLKVPHHGSKTGMLVSFLSQIRPSLAVISVGKNSYGHPTKEALDLLQKIGAEIKRTDISGDIEVISDGKSWKVN